MIRKKDLGENIIYANDKHFFVFIYNEPFSIYKDFVMLPIPWAQSFKVR
jgi:hypothetical protein